MKVESVSPLLRNRTNTMLKWILENPIKSVCIGGCVGSPFINVYLKRKAKKELYSPVYKRLISGSKPSMLLHDNTTGLIPRQKLADDLASFFLPEANAAPFMRFGIINGPSGSGKTQAVRELCNKFPEGTLYYEVCEPSFFVKCLSHEIGMKTVPTTVLDLALSYVSGAYCHYHVLPEYQPGGFAQVIDVLENSAAEYSKKYGKVPVLFIDGVDILAKHDEELFCALITRAKILANCKKLKIVLISSEGTVMPLLKQLSAVNRAIVYEIGDIEKEKATQYLIKTGMMKDKADEVVNCVGGRLVYLESSMKIVGSISNSNDICEHIKTHFFSRMLSGQEALILKRQPESTTIINKLRSGGTVSLKELISDADDKEKMNEVVTDMIRDNILRYDIEGNIKWHGKIQEVELSKLIDK